MRVLRTAGAAVLGLAVGLVVGVVGVLWHHAQVVVGDDRWPLGVVLVVLLAGAAAVAVGAGTAGRAALLGFVLAVTATAVLASVGGPGGDVLVLDDTLGQAYLLGTGFVAVAALVVVRRVRLADRMRRGPEAAATAGNEP